MGVLAANPAQRILINGKKYKAGHSVLRRSEVKADVADTNAKIGVKLGVRIGSDQSVTEFMMDRAVVHELPRDPDGERELDRTDPAAGETWWVWRIPRAVLPADLGKFRTVFRLTPPKGVQTVKWAVVYEDQPFEGGFVMFGHSDVGWSGAEAGGAAAKRRPAGPKGTKAKKGSSGTARPRKAGPARRRRGR